MVVFMKPVTPDGLSDTSAAFSEFVKDWKRLKQDVQDEKFWENLVEELRDFREDLGKSIIGPLLDRYKERVFNFWRTLIDQVMWILFGPITDSDGEPKEEFMQGLHI